MESIFDFLRWLRDLLLAILITLLLIIVLSLFMGAFFPARADLIILSCELAIACSP